MSKSTQFKKGQSGNPSGRPKMPTEILEARKVTSKDFENVLFATLQMNEEQTNQILDDKERSNLERLVARITHDAIMGDDKAYTTVLNRAFGKVPDKVEDTNPFATLTLPEKLAKLKEAVLLLEQKVGSE